MDGGEKLDGGGSQEDQLIIVALGVRGGSGHMVRPRLKPLMRTVRVKTTCVCPET